MNDDRKKFYELIKKRFLLQLAFQGIESSLEAVESAYNQECLTNSNVDDEELGLQSRKFTELGVELRSTIERLIAELTATLGVEDE